jgi:hypothetical protein
LDGVGSHLDDAKATIARWLSGLGAGLKSLSSLAVFLAMTALSFIFLLTDGSLIGAGLLSVLWFPLAGLILLRRDRAAREPAPMLAL